MKNILILLTVIWLSIPSFGSPPFYGNWATTNQVPSDAIIIDSSSYGGTNLTLFPNVNTISLMELLQLGSFDNAFSVDPTGNVVIGNQNNPTLSSLTVYGGITGLPVDGTNITTNANNQLTVGLGVVTNVTVTQFGAKGDGKIANYCTIAASSTTLTRNDNLPWTSADVGKVIKVTQAGPGGNNDFTTTIAAVVNINVVTLSLAPSYGATNVFSVYGTDDTAAIQAGINYATSNNATLTIPNRIYILNGPLVNNTGNLQTGNCSQIYIPPSPSSGDFEFPSITIQGVSTITEGFSGTSNYCQIYGSTLWSTLVTNVNGRVLDCQNFSSPYTTGNKYNVKMNYIKVNLSKLNLLSPVNPVLSGWNLEGAASASVHDVTFACGQQQYSAVKSTNPFSIGLNLPTAGNLNQIDIGPILITGFYNGLAYSEHVNQIGELVIQDCVNAMVCTNGCDHKSIFSQVNINGCLYGVIPSPFINESVQDIYITSENHTPGWAEPMTAMINDPQNKLRGSIVYSYTSSDLSGQVPGIIGGLNAVITSTAIANTSYKGLGKQSYTIGNTEYIETNSAGVFNSYPGNYANNIGLNIFQTLSTYIAGIELTAYDGTGTFIGQFDSSSGDQLGFNTGGAYWLKVLPNAQQINFNGWPITGNGSGLTNTFSPVSGQTNLTINGTGVTNYVSRYGEALVTLSSGTYWESNQFGQAIYTNSTAGTVSLPIAPGGVIHAASGLTGTVMFP